MKKAGIFILGVVVCIGVAAFCFKGMKNGDSTKKTTENLEKNATEKQVSPTPTFTSKEEEILAAHHEPPIRAGNGLTLYQNTQTSVPDTFMIPEPVRIDRNGSNQCYSYCMAMIYRALGDEKADGAKIHKKFEKKYGGGRVNPDVICRFINESDKYEATLYTGTIDNLKDCLSKGTPVLFLGRMSIEDPSYHYMTVTGYDEEKIYIADSYLFEMENDYYNRAVSYDYFSYMWDLELEGYNNIFIEITKK